MELATMHQAQRLEEPLTLDDLVERIRPHAERMSDHRGITLGDTRMDDWGSWRFNGEAEVLSRHAFSQLCSRLVLPSGGTAPASYLARCPSRLAADHVNYWLSQPECAKQQVLVRTERRAWHSRSHVRAVLSTRYAVVDHLPVITMLRRLAPEETWTVQGWSLDDEQFTLRLLVRRDHPVSLDDPIRVGLHISNSEIGLGRISIAGLVTRLVCSNGLVVKVGDLGGVHRRHVGRADASLEEIVQDGLTNVIDQADEAARRFVRLREQKAPQPVGDFVQRTAKEVGFPEELVAYATASVPGETLYDVVNVFTLLAQRLPVPERVRIETAMSEFLSDGRNWN